MEHQLVLAGPAANRAWIIPTWANHLKASLHHKWGSEDVLDRVVMVVPVDDGPTKDALLSAWGDKLELIEVDESIPGKRSWPPDRLHHMTNLRNLALARVRELDPLAMLSIDTDILLHPEAIGSGFELLSIYDAVGIRCYMTDLGTEFPSFANLHHLGGLIRDDRPDWVGRVEVIMGAKMLAQPAYQVDYQYDHRGEDIGWSLACKQEGLEFGWDGSVPASHHVMSEAMLSRRDPRVKWWEPS